jgi:hypothetical protein
VVGVHPCVLRGPLRLSSGGGCVLKARGLVPCIWGNNAQLDVIVCDVSLIDAVTHVHMSSSGPRSMRMHQTDSDSSSSTPQSAQQVNECQ